MEFKCFTLLVHSTAILVPLGFASFIECGKKNNVHDDVLAVVIFIGIENDVDYIDADDLEELFSETEYRICFFARDNLDDNLCLDDMKFKEVEFDKCLLYSMVKENCKVSSLNEELSVKQFLFDLIYK